MNRLLESNKPNGTGIGRVIRASKCSYKGIKAAWRHEAAFRQECALCLVLFSLSFIVAKSYLHWMLLILSAALVLIVELINSSIEALADRVTLEHDELIGRTKDIASAAVLLSLLVATVFWLTSIIIFIWEFQ